MDNLSDWSGRLRALLPGFDTAPSVKPAQASGTHIHSPNLALQQPTPDYADVSQLELPTVPHLFVQRFEALPDAGLDLLLEELQRRSVGMTGSSASISGAQQVVGGFGGTDGRATPPPPTSREELRKQLKQKHEEAMPADADSADYSDEPFDNIARHVELQWRTYVRLYPEEVASNNKLAMLVKPNRHTGFAKDSPSGGHSMGHGLGPSRSDHHDAPQGPGAAQPAQEESGCAPPTGQRLRQAVQDGQGNWMERFFGVGGTGGQPASAAGCSTVGAIPTAGELQQSLLNLTQRTTQSAGQEVMAAAGAASMGGLEASRAASRQAPGTPSHAARGLDDRSLSTGVAAGACGPVQPWRYQHEPAYLQVSGSLDLWHRAHADSLRPLRGGRTARVHALWGAELPAEWRDAMQPSRPGPRGALRWAADAAGVVGGVLGLPRRPRVWVIDGEPCSVIAANDASVRRVNGSGGGESGGVKWGSRGDGGVLVAAGNKAGGIGRPLGDAAVSGAGGGGGRLAGGGSGGLRGLAAAQEAARRCQFALHRTTLVAPELLEAGAPWGQGVL